jgi:hypothetical protein
VIDRRTFVKTLGAGAAAATLDTRMLHAADDQSHEAKLAGRLKQSVSRWPYSKIRCPNSARL